MLIIVDIVHLMDPQNINYCFLWMVGLRTIFIVLFVNFYLLPNSQLA